MVTILFPGRIMLASGLRHQLQTIPTVCSALLYSSPVHCDLTQEDVAIAQRAGARLLSVELRPADLTSCQAPS